MALDGSFLLELAHLLGRKRRATGEPAPLTRPRLAEPPPPVAPAELVTGNTIAAGVRPDLGPLEAPAMAEKTVGLADPLEVVSRPRISDPVTYRGRRLAEMEAEGPGEYKGSRLGALAKGALRGFGMGGLGGAVYGAAHGGIDPGVIARQDWQRGMEREGALYSSALGRRKAEAGVRSEEVANDYRAAQIPYLLSRPELEREKLEALTEYRDETLGLRREANESLADYRNRTLGQRRDANESLKDYRDRLVKLGARRVTETERHNRVSEALGGERVRQGDERIGLARESLTLRERLGTGNLDARWASVEQGYERLDASRRKQVDDLAAKAAAAEAEAVYFESAEKPDKASATLKRNQADNLRRQAEAISKRAVPRALPRAQAQTPPRGPVSGGWGEDPVVREYADTYFKGDYGAAQLAIEEQKRRKR